MSMQDAVVGVALTEDVFTRFGNPFELRDELWTCVLPNKALPIAGGIKFKDLMIDHPAVKANPVRPELIPLYNQMYENWKQKEEANVS